MFLMRILSYLILAQTIKALLFPNNSVLQLTPSIAVPSLDLPSGRRIIWDWGFQINYNMPYRLSSFYNIPIWPRVLANERVKKQATVGWGLSRYATDVRVPGRRKFADIVRNTRLKKHENDFTAGELYRGLEQLLVSQDFHETCLLRTVCELARHPFEDEHYNMLTDTVTFLLTPFQHQGFDATEKLFRESYEDAEQQGFLGENCAHLYSNCEQDLLGLLSKVKLSNG